MTWYYNPDPPHEITELPKNGYIHIINDIHNIVLNEIRDARLLYMSTYQEHNKELYLKVVTKNSVIRFVNDYIDVAVTLTKHYRIPYERYNGIENLICYIGMMEK